MHKLLPGCMLILLSFAACQSRDNTEVINGLSHSLSVANEVIIDNNSIVYHEFNKLMDVQSRAKAQIWHPRIVAVQTLSSNIYKYLDGLKRRLAKMKANDKAEVEMLFKEEGDSIYYKLARYNADVILTLTPDLFENYPNVSAYLIEQIELLKQSCMSQTGILIDSLTGQPVNRQQWQNAYLHTSSHQLGIAVLNKLASHVLVTENRLISYIDNQIGCIIESFEVFRAIAVLNSSYVKAGLPIEVTAGVGSFSAASKPTITINGSVVILDDDGTATYKLTTNQKPGKYQVPVRIEYTKPDGSTNIVTKNLRYTIAE
jgi:hypothetical protein